MNNRPYSSQSILNDVYDPETQSLRITRDMPNGDYAPKEHTHVIGDVINLQNELDSKADVDHNHDEQYLSLSGGSMTGTLHADSPVFTGDISEGGMLLSEKYAAKEHSHNEKADKASTLAGYGIMDAYTKSETDAKISSVYRYRGSVETYADLPTEGQKEGDVWNIASADTAHGINAGDNVAWTADGTWDALSGQVDLTPFALKTDAATDHDHDGTYIKTSGETVVAAHNFAIKSAYTDSMASTRTGYVLSKNGNTIQIGGNNNCDCVAFNAGVFTLELYNYPTSRLRLYGNNKTFFSVIDGDLNVSSSLSEGGTKLSDKYAAITHRHDDDYAAIEHKHQKLFDGNYIFTLAYGGLNYKNGNNVIFLFDGKNLSIPGEYRISGSPLSNYFAAISHTHEIADVSGLQDALDSKSDDVHTHEIADVSGLQDALDAASSSGMPPDLADYVVEQVATLDGWYRRYKSGWVEQGGRKSVSVKASSEGDRTTNVQFNFPVPLTEGCNVDVTVLNNYTDYSWMIEDDGNEGTGFAVVFHHPKAEGGATYMETSCDVSWRACGMSLGN